MKTVVSWSVFLALRGADEQIAEPPYLSSPTRRHGDPFHERAELVEVLEGRVDHRRAARTRAGEVDLELVELLLGEVSGSSCRHLERGPVAVVDLVSRSSLRHASRQARSPRRGTLGVDVEPDENLGRQVQTGAGERGDAALEPLEEHRADQGDDLPLTVLGLACRRPRRSRTPTGSTSGARTGASSFAERRLELVEQRGVEQYRTRTRPPGGPPSRGTRRRPPPATFALSTAYLRLFCWMTDFSHLSLGISSSKSARSIDGVGCRPVLERLLQVDHVVLQAVHADGREVVVAHAREHLGLVDQVEQGVVDRGGREQEDGLALADLLHPPPAGPRTCSTSSPCLAVVPEVVASIDDDDVGALGEVLDLAAPFCDQVRVGADEHVGELAAEARVVASLALGPRPRPARSSSP